MYIRDIRRQFFDELKGRILIICTLDVDAICACKMLQFLLESYNLQYSVASAASTDDFCKAFEDYRTNVDSIVLINFGNLINICRLLKPPPDLKFYVIDSHRPINIYNFYKNPQVRLFINAKREEELNIPETHRVILKNDDGLEDQDEQNLALLAADAHELTNEQLEKRRKLKEWLVRKQKLMFEYEEYHYYNRSVAMIIYELAVELSRNNNYLLWLGIIGLTYQFRSEKISAHKFELEVEQVLRYISRNQVSSSHARGNNWTISLQKDVQLELYRRWTIYDSLYHTPLIVCRFQLYNDKGLRNLSEFMVEATLKVDACQQPFAAMPLKYRYDLVENIQQVCLGDLQDKYNVQELITSSFIMTCAYDAKFCANDIALAIRALLESHDPGYSRNEKFVRAIQSLSFDDYSLLELGFERARLQMRSMFQQVKALITTLKIIDTSVFLHIDLQDHSQISRDFACGDSLISFARFVLSAYVSSLASRLAKRAIRKPLILFCPDFNNPEEIMIVGIPPVAQESKKNFFSKAFEDAAATVGCEITVDLSETSLIRTNVSNKHMLLEQFKVILEG